MRIFRVGLVLLGSGSGRASDMCACRGDSRFLKLGRNVVNWSRARSKLKHRGMTPVSSAFLFEVEISKKVKTKRNPHERKRIRHRKHSDG
jgi:hypothetical protein